VGCNSLLHRHTGACGNVFYSTGNLTITITLTNGVGTNFGVGVGEAKPEGQEQGDGVLEEGTASPSPPTHADTI